MADDKLRRPSLGDPDSDATGGVILPEGKRKGRGPRLDSGFEKPRTPAGAESGARPKAAASSAVSGGFGAGATDRPGVRSASGLRRLVTLAAGVAAVFVGQSILRRLAD